MKCPVFNRVELWNRSSSLLLALCWIIGMLCGTAFAYVSRHFLVPMVSDGVSAQPSFMGLLCAGILPFLLSAFAVSLYEPWLLLIISLFKAFSFSFCATGVSLAFGQSGWLVRFFFLFSDVMTVPLLYTYWLRHISGRVPARKWELPLCIFIATAVICIDFYLIAPFLMSLMNQ